MSVDTTAADGGGFDAAAGFERLIEQNAIGSTQLVVLFDSRLDADDAAVVGEAAERTFVAVERAAPDALLVVVGPLADADGGDALAAAAHDGEQATDVDPIPTAGPSRRRSPSSRNSSCPRRAARECARRVRGEPPLMHRLAPVPRTPGATQESLVRTGPFPLRWSPL